MQDTEKLCYTHALTGADFFIIKKFQNIAFLRIKKNGY